MKAGWLASLLLTGGLMAGCVGSPGATADAPAPADSPGAPESETPVGTAAPTESLLSPPTISASPNTSYTADDEAIAALIREDAAAAVPQLQALNDSDPSKLEGTFLPLGAWISEQKTALAAYTPSSCTTEAVELFVEGLDQYDDIREQFLAWRDWGAKGHAFSPWAPGEAVEVFEAALVELDTRCPG